MGLATEGTDIWLEPNDDPKRKLKFSWKLSELGQDQFVCVDTALPNRVVGEALRSRSVMEFADYDTVKAEVKYSENSRVDFLLSGTNLPNVYLEVKSVTLSRQNGLAEFPDSVTARGAKHLDALAQMVELGHRAVLFYLINRTDCDRFGVARDIDPNYAAALDDAKARGVEVMGYTADISPRYIVLGRRASSA